MKNPFTLEGKKILVTGASSGIGKSIAIECSKMGASVIITGRNTERLQQTMSECQGEDNLMIPFDLSKLDELQDFISQLPTLDGVVQNAGINTKTLVKFLSKQKIDDIYHTNVYAPILIMQQLIKKKKINSNGSVVFISSISSSFAAITNSVYASSKGAINSFMRSLALELAPRNIRANVIRPGMIETPILNAYAMSEELDEFLSSAPLGHPGEPLDIAYGAVYLLSDASKFVTGSILTIDGGMTLR